MRQYVIGKDACMSSFITNSYTVQIDVLRQVSNFVNWLQTYGDYGTNLRLPANFGSWKVLQLERHTELLSLLSYHTTPHTATRCMPAKLLMNRRLYTPRSFTSRSLKESM